MLDLLIFLDAICEKYNLTYWLDSGTLLGAERHGGFIPWDDDVDVCMPREDAQMLKKIMGNKIYEDHIVLQTINSDPNYLNDGWMTLRDTRTEYIQDSHIHNKLKYKGLQVDIFEVECGLSDTTKRISIKMRNQLIHKLAMNYNGSTFMRNIANLNCRIIHYIVNPILRIFKTKDSTYDYGLGTPFRINQSSSLIFPLRTIKFEGRTFKCPRDVDSYLTNIYGSWKIIPSEENIVTHKVSFKFIH